MISTWFPWITARCAHRVLAGGAAVASGLVIAFFCRPAAKAERGRTGAHPRSMAVPASGALARVGTVSVVPVTGHTRMLPKADSLRDLVVTVITDARAPTAVRNACDRLIGAIQSNNEPLVEETLIRVEHAAARTGYRLPPLEPPHARSDQDLPLG